MRAGGRPPARRCTVKRDADATSQPPSTAAPKRRRAAPANDAAAPAEPQLPRAAAPAAAAEPTEVDWHALRRSEPRTLETWLKYVDEPEFWANYENHQTDKKTKELVGVYKSAFGAKVQKGRNGAGIGSYQHLPNHARWPRGRSPRTLRRGARWS